MLTLSFLEILYAAETHRTNAIASVKDNIEDMIVECMEDIISTTNAGQTPMTVGREAWRIERTLAFHQLILPTLYASSPPFTRTPTLRSPHHHHGFSTLWKQSIHQPSRNPFPNHDANASSHRRCIGEKHIDRADSPIH